MPVKRANLSNEEEEQKNGEDAIMQDSSKDNVQTQMQKRIICGNADLNYKRDHMEIKPLYAENGISKKTIFNHFLVNFDYLE